MGTEPFPPPHDRPTPPPPPAYQPLPPPPPQAAGPPAWRKPVLIGCGTLLALSLLCSLITAVVVLVNRDDATPTRSAGVVNTLAGTSIPAGVRGGAADTTPTTRATPTDPAAGVAPTVRPTQTPTPTRTPPPPTPTRPPPTSTITPTAPPTPAPPVNVGQPAPGNGYTLTVQEVQDPVPPQQYLKPKEGSRWVAYDVSITNTGTAPLDYNPFYADLKTADNREHNPGIGAAEPSLKSGKLQPGETVRGWITFEIPNEAQPATFYYDPAFGKNRVTVNLNR